MNQYEKRFHELIITYFRDSVNLFTILKQTEVRERRTKEKTVSAWVRVSLFSSFLIAIIVFFSSAGVSALIQEPTDVPPGDNLSGFLDVGPLSQAKRGALRLGSNVTSSTQLDVNGSGYLNALTVDQNLTVNGNTLFVDSQNNRIGLGTLTPAYTLDVLGGGVSVTTPVSGAWGVAVWSSDHDASYGKGASGIQATNNHGDGSGVWGSSASTYGLFGESTNGSGVIGRVTGLAGGYGVYAMNANVTTGWAGYFTGRLFSSNDVIGRRFLPEQLQSSLVPFAQGQELSTRSTYNLYKPRDLAFDGTNIWVLRDQFSGEVSKVRPEDGLKLSDVLLDDPQGREPTRLIYAANYLWTSNKSGTNVTRIDPATSTQTHFSTVPIGVNCADLTQSEGTYYVGCNPTALVYDSATAGGPYVWVSSYTDPQPSNGTLGTSSIVRIRLSDGVRTGFLLQNSGSVLGVNPVAIAFDGTNIWTVNFGIHGSIGTPNAPVTLADSVTKFQASDGAFLGTFSLGTCNYPIDIVYENVGSRLWVVCNQMRSWENNVIRFNPSSNAADGAFLSGGDYPNRIAVDSITSTGPYVWVTHLQGVSRLKASDGSVVGPFTTGASPGGMTTEKTYTQGATTYTYLWTADNLSYQLSKFKSSDGVLQGNFVIEGTEVAGMTFDGTYVWTANKNSRTVFKIRVADGQRVGAYTLNAPSPRQVLYDGQNVWVTHFYSYTQTSISKLRASDGTLLFEKVLTQAHADPKGMFLDTVTSGGPYVWILVAGWGIPNESHLIRYKISDNSETRFNLGLNTALNPQAPASMVYDGQYLWISAFYDPDPNTINTAGETSSLVRVDIQSCSGSCSIFITTPPSGHYLPLGIAYDGKYLWTANSGVGSVSKWNPNGDGTVTEIANYPVNVDTSAGQPVDNPRQVVFDGTFVWVGLTKRIDTNNYLSILRASDGAVVKNNIQYASYVSPASFAFDGSFVWLGGDYLKGLYKFYSGAGYGKEIIEGVVRLQNSVPGELDTGNINVSGIGTIGGNAIVGANVIASSNAWGGASDTLVNVAGQGTYNCPDGYFVKDIVVDGSNNPTQLKCRPL